MEELVPVSGAPRYLMPPAHSGETDFQRWLETLPTAAYTCNAEGLITYYNRRAAAAWGREPELNSAADRYCGSVRLFNAEGLAVPHDECWMARCLREGKEYAGEEIVVERQDGSRLTVQANVTPFHDEQGRLIGAVNVLVDITERKRAEESLTRRARELDALYRLTDRLQHAASLDALCETALDSITTALQCDRAAILLFDAAGVMRFVAWRRLTENYRGAVEGHSPWVAGAKAPQPIGVTDVERADFPASLKTVVVNEGIRALAFIPLVADGTLLGKFMVYYDAPHVFTDHELEAGLAIGGQIALGVERSRADTERRNAETALRESKERLSMELAATQLLQETSTQLISEDKPEALYEQILDTAVAIMHSDMASMQIVDEEENALRLLGWRGFPPEFGRIFHFVRPDTGTSCGLARRVGHRVVVPDVETCDFIVDTPALEDLRKTGVAAVQSTPLISRSGRLLGMISTHWRRPHRPPEHDLRLLDVLVRQAADLIERTHAEVQRAELLARERAAREALKEADRRKDEFLALLAHELRNPLAPIGSAVQLLRLKGSDDPGIRWSRDVIERQVKHLTRLIDDLMDIGRITRNKLEIRRQRVELGDVIQAAIETSRPVIDERGHKLTVTLPPDPVHLSGDLVRLAQIFMNLLTNAAKYTEPNGSVTLSAELAADCEVIVTVKDNGVGIPADQLPLIFEMFFQADHALGRFQGGLGIGLSLVRRLVELHGGSVSARSDGPGRGSEFTVRLPVIATPANLLPAGQGSDRVESIVVPRRILVADDNRDAAQSLAMLLQLMGHEVHVAHDGLEAVETLRRIRPDVALVDLAMPKLDGYDVCRRIRQEPWGKNVVVIALTGWGQEEDRRRTREAGLDGHMVKPADHNALAELLSSLSPAPSAS